MSVRRRAAGLRVQPGDGGGMRLAFAVVRARFPLESFLQLVEGGTQCSMVGGKRPVDCVAQHASIRRLTLHGHTSSAGHAPAGRSARAQFYRVAPGCAIDLLLRTMQGCR